MSRKGKKEEEVTVQEEVTELLNEKPAPEIDPEALCEEIDPATPCEEVIGRKVRCGKCHADLLTIKEVRVVRGRVPKQFYQTLYRILCAECAEIVVKAIKVAGTKGEVVGYERARNGALHFFRNAVEDGLTDDGCMICGKADPMGKPDIFRHRVIIGLPAEIWQEELEMRQIVGRQLCELHARSAVLAGFRMVPIQKHLDRETDKEVEIQELAEKLNSRRTTNKTGTTDK